MKFLGIDRPCLVLLLAATTCTKLAIAKRSLRRAQSVISACRIVRTIAQVSNGFTAQWRCIPYDNGYEDRSYVIDLPKDYVQDNESELLSGKACVELIDAEFKVVNGVDSILFGNDGDIGPSACPYYGGMEATGSPKSVLVVRATAKDATAVPSASDLRSAFFQEGSVSLSSQVFQCSGSKLDMDQVPHRMMTSVSQFSSGILDASIPSNFRGKDRTVVENEVAVVTRDLLRKGGLAMSDFDHVVFCLPIGTSGDWRSEGYLNWHRSVVNGYDCNDVNYLMNVIGINLGLDPSTDRIGMMGPTVSNKPDMCYDASNSWRLGWYVNEVINPFNKPWGGRIIGIDDYVDTSKPMPSASDYKVLAKIESGADAGQDLYLGYNRESGVNDDTQAYQNKIIVSKRTTEGGMYVVETMSGLSSGSQAEVTNFGGSGNSLFVKVCDLVSGSSQSPYYARVIVYLAQDEKEISCNDVKYVPSGTDVSVSTFQASPSSTSAVTTGKMYCEDDTTRTVTFGSSTWTCENLRINSKLDSRMKANWCANSDAKKVCMATCRSWATCTDPSEKSSAPSEVIVTSNTAVATQSARPASVAAVRTTTTTTTTTERPDISVQQGYGWKRDSCSDGLGIVPGIGMTCDLFASLYENRTSKLRYYCRRTGAGEICRDTCRQWNSC